mmetsp:Transcript_20929/g.33704  ORF Transcript_20929/g.33704 Transcript_20929/m.33704 type:complete len:113 (-) Transcript_20929:28-366(-)
MTFKGTIGGAHDSLSDNVATAAVAVGAPFPKEKSFGKQMELLFIMMGLGACGAPGNEAIVSDTEGGVTGVGRPIRLFITMLVDCVAAFLRLLLCLRCFDCSCCVLCAVALVL